MKVHSLFVSILIAFLAISCFANGRRGEGYGGFSTGLNLIDAKGVNRSVAIHDLKFDDQQWALGGVGFGVVGPGVILGGEGYGFTQEASSDTMSGTLSGGYGFFNVGYEVLRVRDLFAYPFIGIGGGGYTLKLVRDTGEHNAQTLINEANQMVELNRGSFLLELGLGAGYLIDMSGLNKKSESSERGGFFLGFRAGYIFDPTSTSWSFAGSKVRNGPDLKSNTFFVTMQFGGGGGQPRYGAER
jgi:hypothetical protein